VHYPLSLNAPWLTRVTDDHVTEDKRDRRRFIGGIPGNPRSWERHRSGRISRAERGLDGDRTCSSRPVNPVRACQGRVSCRKQGSVAGISARFQNRTRFRRGTKSNASAPIHHAALLDGKFRIEYSYGDSGPFCFSHIPWVLSYVSCSSPLPAAADRHPMPAICERPPRRRTRESSLIDFGAK
jgi:hypothetical protein